MTHLDFQFQGCTCCHSVKKTLSGDFTLPAKGQTGPYLTTETLDHNFKRSGVFRKNTQR